MNRVLGIVLILIGLAGIAWGGLSWNKRNDVDLGPVDIAVTEKKTVPIPPIAGAVAVVAGLALILAGGTRRGELQ
jgi:hypothetical protein